MIRVGFIDYFLSEWHANTYPTLFSEEWSGCGYGEFKVAYAWAEVEISPYDGVSTDEWCAKQGVTRAASIEEVCRLSDVIVILSPDNPERHLDYAKRVFPFGKPVYMDKTFAPNSEIAAEIVALAAHYNTPFFSSSALRFTTELAPYRACEKGADGMMCYGPNGADIYAIHLVEMIAVVMKQKPLRVMGLTGGKNGTAVIEYEDGRRALYCQNNAVGFGFAATVEKDGENCYLPIKSDMFRLFVREMLAFFAEGKCPVTPEETLSVMRLLDAVKAALKTPDTWIPVK